MSRKTSKSLQEQLQEKVGGVNYKVIKCKLNNFLRYGSKAHTKETYNLQSGERLANDAHFRKERRRLKHVVDQGIINKLNYINGLADEIPFDRDSLLNKNSNEIDINMFVDKIKAAVDQLLNRNDDKSLRCQVDQLMVYSKCTQLLEIYSEIDWSRIQCASKKCFLKRFTSPIIERLITKPSKIISMILMTTVQQLNHECARLIKKRCPMHQKLNVMGICWKLKDFDKGKFDKLLTETLANKKLLENNYKSEYAIEREATLKVAIAETNYSKLEYISQRNAGNSLIEDIQNAQDEEEIMWLRELGAKLLFRGINCVCSEFYKIRIRTYMMINSMYLLLLKESDDSDGNSLDCNRTEFLPYPDKRFYEDALKMGSTLHKGNGRHDTDKTEIRRQLSKARTMFENELGEFRSTIGHRDNAFAVLNQLAIEMETNAKTYISQSKDVLYQRFKKFYEKKFPGCRLTENPTHNEDPLVAAYLKVKNEQFRRVEMCRYAEYASRCYSSQDEQKEWENFAHDLRICNDNNYHHLSGDDYYPRLFVKCENGLFFDGLLRVYYRMMKVIEPEREEAAKNKPPRQPPPTEESKSQKKSSSGRKRLSEDPDTFDPDENIKGHGRLISLMPSFGSFNASYIPFPKTSLKELVGTLNLTPSFKSKKKVDESVISNFFNMNIDSFRPNNREKGNHWKFAMFKTDGDSVSVVFQATGTKRSRTATPASSRGPQPHQAKVKCGIDPGARTLLMGYYDYGPNEKAPNPAIQKHFCRLERQKLQDPNHRIKLQMTDKGVIPKVDRKDTGEHLFEYSADKYYHEIMVNESIKQTRLARYMKTVRVRSMVNGVMTEKTKAIIDIEREVPCKKTIDIKKYMTYVRYVLSRLVCLKNFAFMSSDRKWRFTRHCAKQRVYSQLADKFKKCQVGFGSVSGKFVNRIRGKRCVPIEETKIQLLRRKVDLKVINEFRTSKICHECHYKSEQSPRSAVMDKHDYESTAEFIPNLDFHMTDKQLKDYHTTYSKVVSCKFSCGTIMNRDVNAAMNICALMSYDDNDAPVDINNNSTTNPRPTTFRDSRH